MTNMNSLHIKQSIDQWSSHGVELEKTLNSADSLLGDGDTGSMLLRVIGALSAIEFELDSDLASTFSAMAKATLSTTGSSLGTLIATAFMTIAKQTQNVHELTDSEFAEVLMAAKSAIEKRGSASSGDKTVIDALDAVIRGLQAAPTEGPALDRVKTEVTEALHQFRDKPCKIGRARMFEASSIGKDDPGMLAVWLLVNQIHPEQG